MGFSVQNNLTAMNSNRMLGLTSSAQASSTEKLSSGYKINRAADDAAGLSISEKMRRQIRGLTQASANAEDGISSVQTAEGALTEVHDMLQRMNELANKASNGTMSEDDRQSVQDEIDQLLTEVDRVAETSKFNEIYLLKGNAEGTTSTQKVNAHDAGLAGKLVDNGNTATFTLDSDLKDGSKINIAGTEYTIGSGATKDVDSCKALSEVSATAATAGTLGAETVKAGDTIYDSSTDTTYTLVDKVAANSTAISGAANGATVTITDSNGNATTYTVAGSTTLANHEVKNTDAKTLIDEALEAGSTVTFKASASGTELEVVDSLTQDIGGTYEISTATATATTLGNANSFYAATGITLAEGDKVTLSGKEYNMTDYAASSAKDVTSMANKLAIGDKISIQHTQSDGTTTVNTITIGSETNATNNTYTVSDAISLLKDGDDVSFGINTTNTTAVNGAASLGYTLGAASAAGTLDATNQAASATMRYTDPVTVVGDATSSDETTITKAEALEKVAEELTKASSIGTDTGSEATVKNNGDGSFTITKGSVEVKDSLKFSLHVGADADMTNKIGVTIDAMDTAGLGIKGLDVTGSSVANATYSIDSIEDAIKKVSEQRSALGAVQNRLEHTIKNLDNIVENTTSAESQIRDTDMATEMVKFSNLNILAQAGTSMLAQANQSSQNILSLLG